MTYAKRAAALLLCTTLTAGPIALAEESAEAEMTEEGAHAEATDIYVPGASDTWRQDGPVIAVMGHFTAKSVFLNLWTRGAHKEISRALL